MTVPEADALLTGPGGFFELAREQVNGVEMDVFANRHRNLRQLLAASANHGEAGSSLYYVFDSGPEATFAQNIGHAAAAAEALRSEYGITKGDRVAILGANQPGWIQGFWGTVSLGAIAVALNGWWKGPEIHYGLDLTAPKVLIADRRRLERLESAGGVGDLPVIVMEDEFAALLERFAGATLPQDHTAPIDEDDPAAILFTSGTTGRPRGAICTHRNFMAYLGCAFVIGARDAVRFPSPPPPAPPAEPTGDAPADDESDAGAKSPAFAAPGPSLAAGPLFHVSGLHACAVTAVASGMGHVWTTGRFDPEKVFRLTERYRISRWSGVTTQVWRLIEHPKRLQYDTTSVNSVGGGGSVWSPELQRACRVGLPHAEITVSVGYGLTESAGLAVSAPDDILREHPHTVGHPIPTAEVSIRDDNDQQLPDGEVGNVCLRGPMVMAGYWNDPDATRATIRPGGWLRTGDHGHMRHGLLMLAGRRSDLIIRGGENVYPTEIENRLDEHPDVSEVAVVGVDHRELGQEVKAVVVLNPTSSVTEAQLAGWVGEALADFKVPAHWEIRHEPLPRNAAGKILKDVVAGGAESAFIEE